MFRQSPAPARRSVKGPLRESKSLKESFTARESVQRKGSRG
ncbi:hypothetical protein ATK30_8357 [Amycolatopsis echigonensis]|uniref:Uncharacterized protein n=1 Tax=Amycolatopsis echigonensis TaxID=2576905 RepID=A0A2N3WU19_9PSEU|nr:hypothetical protein ATK30_8357 [Amycolatopsis niigatensis]